MEAGTGNPEFRAQLRAEVKDLLDQYETQEHVDALWVTQDLLRNFGVNSRVRTRLAGLILEIDFEDAQKLKRVILQSLLADGSQHAQG